MYVKYDCWAVTYGACLHPLIAWNKIESYVCLLSCNF
jgi:hypothetical protein